jgi:signal transduction histidine kinase
MAPPDTPSPRHDVTQPSSQLTGLEQRVAQLEAALAASRAELQEFTYTVSHDLRAPLRHLVSFARLLEEEAGPQLSGESAEFLRTISESAAHMGVMLDALAVLSRLQSTPVHFAVADVAALARESLREAQAAYAGRVADGQLEVQFDVPEGLSLNTDAAILHKALALLLDNAFKFTAKVPSASVTVRARAVDGGRVHIEIEDNGAGFHPAQQDKLFKVFGRLHSAKQFPGLGMGLLTAKRLLAMVGAQLSLAPREGGGAVAVVRFGSDSD